MTYWHETPEGREALSRKYGNDAAIVLPLSNGRWAVFDNARNLHNIVALSDLPTELALIAAAQALRDVPLPGTFAFEGVELKSAGRINLEELGL